jgi:DNA-binding NarL/FixJ family response regulator
MTMIEPILARPCILVIEDEENQRRQIVNCLKAIPPELAKQKGIGGFEIEEAYSVEQAQLRIEQASRSFDLVLLDLNLPLRKPLDGTESTEYGLQLFNFVMESEKVKGVIIVSVFDQYKYVIGTMRGGALDFVAKGSPFQLTLPTPFLNALARVMAGGSTRIMSQRICDLVPYAELGLAHGFRGIFNEFQRSVTAVVDDIERYARERYGLDVEKDANDSLVLQLRSHHEAVLKARQEWSVLQAELARGGNDSEVVSIEKILAGLRDSLLPALVVKKATFTPPVNPVMVHNFDKDVPFVLREIIVGTLNELPDYGDEREIKVGIRISDGRAAVTFEDNLDPIPEEEGN